jgi:2-amino-4-hydroxy-6-hydroxymethyldihydropteridine diphosphokinase
VATAYLGLGANLGDRWGTLRAALQRLRAEPGTRLLAASAFYETDPVGGPAGQPAYLNAAAAIETDKSPHDLLRFLQSIEHAFGRVRTVKDGPRTLDLDILLYDDLVIDTPDLTVPHPRMHERAFVLVPLADIAGHLVSEKLNRLPEADRAGVVRAEPPARSQPLVGMRALVTGSTSGIGVAIASAFVERGASVLSHGRRGGGGTLGFASRLTADLSIPSECDWLAEESWGDGLDVLVCNAGADTLTGDAAKWDFDRKLDALLNVDLKGTMRLARNLGARMKARGRGVILTVGWDQAETGMEGDSGQLFAAVKGAVTCFTRSLAKSLAPEVRVNCLAPGWIRTAWGETASAVWQERVRRETPLGVWGLPEEVAAAAVWLASPESRFLTGQTIRVNGGVT